MIVRRKATIERTLRRLSQKAIGAPAAPLGGDGTAWAAPAFLSSWANYEAAGEWMPAAYRKGRDGKVTIRGLVKHASATGTLAVFILPVGFRPSKKLIFTQYAAFAGVNQAARLDVWADGQVVVYAPAPAVTDYLSLNVSFYPD